MLALFHTPHLRQSRPPHPPSRTTHSTSTLILAAQLMLDLLHTPHPCSILSSHCISCATGAQRDLTNPNRLDRCTTRAAKRAASFSARDRRAASACDTCEPVSAISHLQALFVDERTSHPPTPHEPTRAHHCTTHHREHTLSPPPIPSSNAKPPE